MRTTVSLDDALLEQAKRRATRSGVTLSRVLEDALRRDLAAPPPSSRPVELSTVSGGRLRPGVDPLSNRDLFESMDLEDARR
ncbi:MAG: ribbon-helix-helix domain-containing protein [Propionibacteriaceae bacterium]|jgi:hypothetical protein|nr:ribbon-helix-helix domain-containing protein [Propionibacteriaceae bacterium]